MHVQAEEVILKGKEISRGIAIGKPYFLKREDFKIFELNISPTDTEGEIRRYRNALSRSKQDIKRLQKQLEVEKVHDGILILDAQLEMLQDPLLTTEIENHIRESNKNAEFVFQKALTKFQKKFNALGDAFFKERFNDLTDVTRRILSYLHESGNQNLSRVPQNSIVCAEELTASDAAEATNCSICGFITENGGETSHAAIVAKAKGIPYITNVNLKPIKENADCLVILDGRKGTVILNPKEDTLKKYQSLKDELDCHSKTMEHVIKLPPETYDGYKVRLFANIESVQEVESVHQFGGGGVGLFRSEYIFLPKNEIPSEDEQFQIYSSLVEKMNGLPVVIRTFDLGGDKTSIHYSFSTERNPFLGCRATRFLLKEQDLFKAQIKAILRANEMGNVSILFPMISTLPELREAKKMVYEAQEELKLSKPIRIGCMIEVPSAALIADYFAKECDFLSIGTNDLVQYSLAVDRSDQMLTELYEPSDPSVLRLIKLITHEANQEGIPVGVCGEVASDPRFTPLLLGLGVQELSVTPRSLVIIKNAIRNTSLVEAVHLAEKALSLTTAHEVLELLSAEYQKCVPRDLNYNPEYLL